MTADDKHDAAAIKARGAGSRKGDLDYNDLMDEIERLERKIALRSDGATAGGAPPAEGGPSGA